MKLNKKQKRVLVSIPIVIIVVAGVFPLFDWMLGGDHDEIMKAFRGGLAAACGGALFGVLSLLFNWPWDLRDEELPPWKMNQASVKILIEALIAILCLLLGAFIGVFLDRSGYLGPPIEHTGAAKVLIPLSILVIIAWAIIKICKQNKEGKNE